MLIKFLLKFSSIFCWHKCSCCAPISIFPNVFSAIDPKSQENNSIISQQKGYLRLAYYLKAQLLGYKLIYATFTHAGLTTRHRMESFYKSIFVLLRSCNIRVYYMKKIESLLARLQEDRLQDCRHEIWLSKLGNPFSQT